VTLPAGTPAPRLHFVPVADDWNAASARLRVFLPIEFLCRAGDDAARLDLARVRAGDVVVFSKRYDDEARALAREARQRGATALLDLCDNHFWVPDDAPQLQARADSLRRMLDEVDGVSLSTEALQEVVARERPDLPSAVIDDALDPMVPGWAVRLRQWTRRRERHRVRIRGEGLRLCWFGHHGDAAPPFGLVDLAPLLPLLAELHERTPLQLTVITGSEASFDERIGAVARVPVRFKPWRRETLRALLVQHDACLLPVRDNPFTRCKSANRLLLALHAGVPVVADPLRAYVPFAAFARLDGFAAALGELARDRDALHERTLAGQRHVRSTWIPARVVEQWRGWAGRFAGERGAVPLACTRTA
jgi:hypothetical protein